MENSFMKIFRPWDDSEIIVTTEEQDSTISTTSQEELEKYETSSSSEGCKSPVETKTNVFNFKETPTKTKKEKQVKKSSTLPTLSNQAEYPLSFESYPLYPDLLHANLAQSLGLNPTDPLFMESVAQGYAMEEYARIISQEQQTKLLNGRKQRPKKYKCPHCDVGFSNNGQLKGHIRIHTGERPYRCDEENCGKTFTRNEELTRHKRIHSGLRPFPCNQCGKRFGRKDHLKKHTRTHMQHRGVYAVPVMLHPMEAWAPSPTGYPYIPLYGY